MNRQNAIWIASYPKSGNTLVHSVIRVAGKNYGFPQADMDAYNLQRNGLMPMPCPAVDQRVINSPSVVLKTHSIYKKNAELHSFPELKLVNGAFVHVYRNPLDVLLSYLNFTRIEYKTKRENYGYKQYLFVDMLGFKQPLECENWVAMTLDTIPRGNLDHALDYFSDHGLNIKTLSGIAGSWIDNTRSWISASNDLPGCSMRYEDCLANPEEFTKLCSLFVFTRDDVLKALKFVNTSAQLMSASGNQEQTVFYNKMKAFYFVDYFSQESIERFMLRNETILKETGYAAILQNV